MEFVVLAIVIYLAGKLIVGGVQQSTEDVQQGNPWGALSMIVFLGLAAIFVAGLLGMAGIVETPAFEQAAERQQERHEQYGTGWSQDYVNERAAEILQQVKEVGR